MSPLIRHEGRRERSWFLSQRRQYNAKVKRALRKVRHDYKQLKPPMVEDQFFGSPQVDPKFLTICIFFKDDDALGEAEQKGCTQMLSRAIRDALREECYPQESVSEVQIQFVSRKAVRAAGGIWHYFR